MSLSGPFQSDKVDIFTKGNIVFHKFRSDDKFAKVFNEVVEKTDEISIDTVHD